MNVDSNGVESTARVPMPLKESEIHGTATDGHRDDCEMHPQVHGKITARFPQLSSHITTQATTNFDHGYNISATERARRSSLSAERGYRRSKPREGNLKHHSRQGRIWLRQRSPRHDQSGFHSSPRY